MSAPREKARAGTSIRVVVDIKPGKVTPAQLTSWRNLWRRLITEVNAAEKEEPSSQDPTNDDHEEKISR